MIRRILGSVLVLICVITLPYWIYIPVLFISIILFPFFWEGLLFAFLIEAVHGSGMDIPSSLFSPLALSVFFALVILLPIRKSLRTYV